MVQTVDSRSTAVMRTTRCPIRIDGELLTSPLAAPRIGEHNDTITDEFNL
jgi:crotonobetainyl-CoA:carnitine CoA-transferase CaiB-like acyl-CoA transferase